MLILPWVPFVWLPQVSVSPPSASVAPSVLLKGAPPSTPPGPRRRRGSHHQRWRRHRPRHTCGSNGWFLAVFFEMSYLEYKDYKGGKLENILEYGEAFILMVQCVCVYLQLVATEGTNTFARCSLYLIQTFIRHNMHHTAVLQCMELHLVLVMFIQSYTFPPVWLLLLCC